MHKSVPPDSIGMLTWFLQGSRKHILREFSRLLGRRPDIAKTGLYHYWQGDHPALLIAHMDTVFEEKGYSLFLKREKSFPPRIVVGKNLQTKNTVFTAPSTGLGADDRAGVAAIYSLLLKGYRPSVLLTDGEESDGTGSNAFCEDIISLPSVSYMIEIDRKGRDEVVYYNMDPDDDKTCEFSSLLEKYFTRNRGCFTDISILAPYFNIAAANVSCGGYEQHTQHEYLIVEHWETIILRLENILTKTQEWDLVEYVSDYSFPYLKDGSIVPYSTGNKTLDPEWYYSKGEDLYKTENEKDPFYYRDNTTTASMPRKDRKI